MVLHLSLCAIARKQSLTALATGLAIAEQAVPWGASRTCCGAYRQLAALMAPFRVDLPW